MLDLLQHLALIIRVLDLLHLDDLRLLQHLDGIVSLIMLGLHQMHTSKTSSSKSSLDIEVGQIVLALCSAHLRLLRLLLLLLWLRRLGLRYPTILVLARHILLLLSRIRDACAVMLRWIDQIRDTWQVILSLLVLLLRLVRALLALIHLRLILLGLRLLHRLIV